MLGCSIAGRRVVEPLLRRRVRCWAMLLLLLLLTSSLRLLCATPPSPTDVRASRSVFELLRLRRRAGGMLAAVRPLVPSSRRGDSVVPRCCDGRARCVGDVRECRAVGVVAEDGRAGMCGVLVVEMAFSGATLRLLLAPRCVGVVKEPNAAGRVLAQRSPLSGAMLLLLLLLACV